MSVELRAMREKAAHLVFENRYGVDTAGRTNLDDFDLHTEDRVFYMPASWFTLRRALARRSVGGDDVFLDLGSGKGRMVLEAARYPFQRVIGVELAEPLHATAQRNAANCRMRRRCDRIELFCSDVERYDIPDDVSVVFMNNPFRGPVFAHAVSNLIESYDRAPRTIRLVYDNPTEHDTLMRTGRFELVRSFRRRSGKSRGPFGTTSVYSMRAAAREVA